MFVISLFFRIKDKINNPPEKRDHQKVSHSLARFIKLKEAAKNQSSKKSNEQKRVRRATNDNEDKPGESLALIQTYYFILTNFETFDKCFEFNLKIRKLYEEK